MTYLYKNLLQIRILFSLIKYISTILFIYLPVHPLLIKKTFWGRQLRNGIRISFHNEIRQKTLLKTQNQSA